MTIRRFVILGFDGLSWDIVDNFIEKGYLTILKELKNKGVNGRVKTIPPSTPPMWTSITSGVNPGKHALYGFIDYSPSGDKIAMNTSLSVMHPRFHDYVTQNNSNSFVINLPYSSWPKIPFKGALISDWLSPKKYAFPIQLDNILKRNEMYFKEKDCNELICNYIVEDIVNLQTLLDYFDNSMYNYIFINVNFIDKAMHKVPHELLNIKKACFRQHLNTLDKLLKELYDRVKDDSLVIVVSDHGLQLASKTVSVNKLLYNKGLIKKTYVEGEAFTSVEAKKLDKIIISLGNRLVQTPLISPLLIKIGKLLLSKNIKMQSAAVKIKRPRPDVVNSIAFMVPGIYGGIYINKKLINTQKEYETILHKIIEILENYELSVKEKIFYRIYIKDEVFSGPFAYKAPDMIVTLEKGFKFSLGLSGNIIERIPKSGDHYYSNMHIITSPDPSIQDLAKKIKYPWDYAILGAIALNFPIPHDTDSVLPNYCKNKSLRHKNYNTKYNILRKITQKKFVTKHK